MNDHSPEPFEDVLNQLSVLEPGAAEGPRPAGQALARLHQRLERDEENSMMRRFLLMFQRKYVYVTALAIVMLAVAFSFPAVRAAASDFLGLFRVQKFAAISVSPQQLAVLEQIAERGLYPGELEMIEEPSEPVEVESVAAAEEATGVEVRTPAELGEPDRVYVSGGGSGRLIINLEDARAIMEAAGADPRLLPDSLDGAEINVTIYDGISQNWDSGTVLMQMPSPLVEYPEDVDTAPIAEAILQALGMERAEARRLSRAIDWTSTMLLPIPEGVASFQELMVDGEAGIGLTSVDGQNSALLWQKDGILYVLSGASLDTLQNIGNSLVLDVENAEDGRMFP
jgi:hypothetical protein